MKDYFQSANNPFKFETNYYLTEENLVVTHQKTQHKYKITKTKIKQYEIILEKQYKKIINNQNEIIQNKREFKTTVYCFIAALLCMLSIISSELEETLGMLLCASSVMTFVINAIDNAVFTFILKEKIRIYELFLKERKELEKNIVLNDQLTNNLSHKTALILKQNQTLKQQNIIDNIFSINFMDKARLYELKKILYIYSINNSDKGYIINDNASLKLIDKVNKIKTRSK